MEKNMHYMCVKGKKKKSHKNIGPFPLWCYYVRYWRSRSKRVKSNDPRNQWCIKNQ